MTGKAEITSKIKVLKKTVATAQARFAAQEVTKRIERLECFGECTRMILYHSLSDELPTDSMLRLWQKASFGLFLPRVNGNDIDIVSYDGYNLKLGAFNIQEPTGSDVLTKFLTTDIAIIPGVAFDKNFNRLGRGRGYYDRFLASFPGVKIGICFDFQIVSAIPCEPHDVKMDAIVTPSLTLVSSLKKQHQ